MHVKHCVLVLLTPLCVGSIALADDWPNWGRDTSRNMISAEKNLPSTFTPPEIKDDGSINMSAAKGVKWVARLGSASYGNPTAASGRVFLGTNNDPPRDPKYSGDYGIVLCLDEAAGKMLWQLAVPKLEAGKNCDYENVGICSSAAVDGDRAYVVTSRCEVLCLDVKDGKVVWRFDMRDELGVFPHQMTSSSVLIVGDRLYATTSNGRDWSPRGHIPAPSAPALICLDKKTGKLLGQEASGISQRMFLCNWSSPAYAKIGDRELIIFGADDGFCYAFDPVPVKNAAGASILKEIWRFDCNPPEYRVKNGKPMKFGAPSGPSGILATPVVYNSRVYVAIGQDPESGEGAGCLSCIDATKIGDISTTGKVWTRKMGRSISTVSIADGLLYTGEFAGFVRCLDANTGEEYWIHDLEARIWGSTLVADGKVYVGNESGALTIFSAGKTKKLLSQITLAGPVLSSPVVAHGVLYVTTDKYLYAIKGDK